MEITRVEGESQIRRPTSAVRRYAFGAYALALNWIGLTPSQRVRRMLFQAFGMKIAIGAVIFAGCRVRAPHRIVIGTGTSIGDNANLDGRGGLTFGRNVNMSSEVMVWTAQHAYDDPDFAMVTAPVVIEDYAWLGPRVIVLPGSFIAEGVVIAAGSVVRGATEPYGLYAGTPAKRIGERQRGARYIPSMGYTPFI